MRRGNVRTGDGFEPVKETPGPGGPVYVVRRFRQAPPFTVWWVYKRHFQPTDEWHLVTSDDLIVMTVGTMRFEFRDGRPPITLAEGECVWMPAGTVTRGIALPTDGTPAAFLSVTERD